VSVEAGKFVAVSASRWIVLVGRHLYTTTDAGRQWTTRVPKPDFSASRVFEFDFASANDGWLLADPFSSAGNAPPAFDYTDDGGLTWHRLGGR